MAIKVKHQGKSPHRYKENPLELAFAEAWQNICDTGRHLEYLMSEDNKPDPIDDNDRVAANTVIQWLGSPVGQGFLVTVLAKPAAEEFLKYLASDVTIKDKLKKLLK